MSEHKYKEAYDKGYEDGKKHAFDGWVKQCYDELTPKEQIELLMKWGAKLPTVEPQEWISVKKHGNPKLKDGKNYDTFLTTSKWVGDSGNENIEVDINVWNREGTWDYHSWGGDEVIAWMPLPSPYKGE